MKWLAGGLASVCASTATALVIGTLAHGLNKAAAVGSVIAGLMIGALAWWQTTDTPAESETSSSNPAESTPPETKKKSKPQKPGIPPVRYDYRRAWFWLLATCFALMALRSFCWLLYIDGDQLKIQSPNNLGDLGLHLTYIRNFASGVALWPDNPIYVFSHLRYPAGTDLFNAILTLLGMDLIRSLVWVGLIASIATFYAFYRWAGNFGVAAFLFNGGVAGYQVFQKWNVLDYQGDKSIAWKSIPLSMFVPQRGMLYALPVGLLLLCHWRQKYRGTSKPIEKEAVAGQGFIPFWLEILLYSTLPLFHAHTFLALSFVVGIFFLLGSRQVKKQTMLLAVVSFLPAGFLAWLITDHFQAGSVLEWKPGWVQQSGDFAMPFLKFWLVNFWIWIPTVLATLYFYAKRMVAQRADPTATRSEAMTFLGAGSLLFLLACLVKTAPWEWDNIKLLVWSYFLVLPFIVSEFVALLPTLARVALYLLMFTSGAVSLLGGLAAGKAGFGIADRNELDNVRSAVRKIPVEARIAAYPSYNSSVLLSGRKSVLGYPGHLWTQGFNYTAVETKLKCLMLGQAGWPEAAKDLRTRYLFWGFQETANYAGSVRPWERESAVVAKGPWGAIYDLEQPRQ